MAVVGPALSDSFGYAFWIAFALTALILIPASFLPRHAARDRREAPQTVGKKE